MFVTNTVSAGLFMGVGDIATQKFERYRARHKVDQQNVKHNWTRTRNMFVMGLALGPIGHFWYRFLDGYLPSRSLRSVAKKVVLDQCVAGPFLYVLFFSGAGALEGQSFREITQEIKEKFLTIFLLDLSVWPPAQFINFTFVPPQFRVIYVSGITLVWDTVLSFVKYNERLL